MDVVIGLIEQSAVLDAWALRLGSRAAANWCKSWYICIYTCLPAESPKNMTDCQPYASILLLLLLTPTPYRRGLDSTRAHQATNCFPARPALDAPPTANSARNSCNAKRLPSGRSDPRSPKSGLGNIQAKADTVLFFIKTFCNPTRAQIA